MATGLNVVALFSNYGESVRGKARVGFVSCSGGAVVIYSRPSSLRSSVALSCAPCRCSALLTSPTQPAASPWSFSCGLVCPTSW